MDQEQVNKIMYQMADVLDKNVRAITTDDNEALFVGLRSPHRRVTINVEMHSLTA